MLGSRGSIDQCSIPVSSNNAIIVYIRWFKIVRILLGSILAQMLSAIVSEFKYS